MKKIFVAAVAAILALTLASCGFASEPGETKKIEGTGTAASETTPDDGDTDTFSIEKQVCFEKDGVKVTAVSAEDNLILGKGIKLLVENDSDRDVTVGTNAVIVNNFMVSSIYAADVAKGKKDNSVLYITSASLEAAGIKKIGQIEIYFHVYDSESYDDIYDSECVTIKTSLFDSMDTKADDSGSELYNKNGIRVVGKYVDENSIWGASVVLYIENNTDKNINVSCDDLSVNGYMATAFFYSLVYGGKRSFDNITLPESVLEETDIKNIETIELKLKIYEADSLDTIDETGPLTFTVK